MSAIIQSDKYADLRVVHVEHSEMIHDEYDVPEEWKIQVKDETEIKAGDILATMDEATIAAQHGGKVRIEKRKVMFRMNSVKSRKLKFRPLCACWSKTAIMSRLVNR